MRFILEALGAGAGCGLIRTLGASFAERVEAGRLLEHTSLAHYWSTLLPAHGFLMIATPGGRTGDLAGPFFSSLDSQCDSLRLRVGRVKLLTLGLTPTHFQSAP